MTENNQSNILIRLKKIGVKVLQSENILHK